MTTAVEERSWWDEQARTTDTARVAVGGVQDAGWDELAATHLAEAVPPVVPDAWRTEHPRLLDLGCGIGRLTIPAALRWREAEVIGVDVSTRMLTLARARMLTLARARVADVGVSVRFVVGDGRRLPVVGPFEGAWSILTFQHLPPEVVQGYLSEVRAVLVPGGRFRFQFVDGDYHAPLHHQVSEADVVRWCANAGLAVETVERGVFQDEWTWVTAVQT